MNRKELAQNSFRPLNCNQAVVSVFASDFGADKNTVMALGAGFGGGMAQGKTCGVVTGAYMAIGLWAASKTEDITEQKELAKAKIKLFNARFLDQNASLECSTLLGYDMADDDERAKAKAAGLFDSKCKLFVGESVAILEEILD